MFVCAQNNWQIDWFIIIILFVGQCEIHKIIYFAFDHCSNFLRISTLLLQHTHLNVHCTHHNKLHYLLLLFTHFNWIFRVQANGIKKKRLRWNRGLVFRAPSSRRLKKHSCTRVYMRDRQFDLTQRFILLQGTKSENANK